jgi:NAD-dependent dihydropyrimidine dehydrogenase PreA subunit
MFELTYLKNVATLKLDQTKCNGCRMCINVCPHAVFALENKHAVIANHDACMECGACARNCETGAISVKAGVGCAAAVINSKLGRKGAECCCSTQTTTQCSTGPSCN